MIFWTTWYGMCICPIAHSFVASPWVPVFIKTPVFNTPDILDYMVWDAYVFL